MAKKKRDFNENQTVEIPWPDMILLLDSFGCEPPADPVAAVRTATEVIREQSHDLKRLRKMRASLEELLRAMKEYEMDVDVDPPNKHREMMQRARDVLGS